MISALSSLRFRLGQRILALIILAVLVGGLGLFTLLFGPLATLGLVGGALILGLAFTHVRLLPYLVLGALILGQLVRLRLGGDSSGAILAIDLVTGLYVVLGLIFALATRKAVLFSLPLIWLIGFLAWIALGLAINAPDLTGGEFLTALFYGLRFALMVGVIFVTPILFPREEAIQPIIRALMGAGIILMLLGYGQLLLLPDFAFMAKYGWDPHFRRILSTFFDPNFFGFFMVMIGTLALARFLTTPRGGRGWWLALFGAATGAVILTFSRSSYLALAVSLLVISTLRSWRLVIATLVILALLVTTIPRIRSRVMGAISLDRTARERLESWRKALVIAEDRPLTGVGYNAFGPAQVRYQLLRDLRGHSSRGSDSSLLLILATTGFIGLGLYLLFFISLFWEAVLVYLRPPSSLATSLGLASLGLLPSYLIHSQFVNSLFYPLLFVPFGFLVAALLVAARRGSP